MTWNDAQFGGDYDMDIVGYISYAIEGSQLKVTTDILNVDGGMPGSAWFQHHGAVSNAGRYITHGSHWINFGECAKNADSTPKLLSRQNYALRCGYGDDAGMPTGAGFDNWAWPSKYGNTEIGFAGVETASTRAFSFEPGQAGSVLADPLWYAAVRQLHHGEDKFSPVSKATLPDAKADAEGYFLARNPAKLEVACVRPLTRSWPQATPPPAVSSAQLVSDSIKVRGRV